MIADRPNADPAGERERRRRELFDFGTAFADLDALLDYTENHFAGEPDALLGDEEGVEAWREYTERAATEGTLSVLRQVLVQLRFPVSTGISETDDYRAACRRGQAPGSDGPGLALRMPEALDLSLEWTPAGSVPVLTCGCREDFVALVQALTARNEPRPVPPAVGAYMISGYTNWDRVARFRRSWIGRHPGGDWQQGMAELRNRPESYQDRFILVSPGPYSGVAATEFGLLPADWERLSLRIRVAHEACHYYTRRALGSMRNNLFDELIADYSGLVAACGEFRADWFLRGLGLQDFPRLDPRGRVGTYRGQPPLGDSAFATLCRLLIRAAAEVEAADIRLAAATGPERRWRVVSALTRSDLVTLAAVEAASRIVDTVGATW